MPTAKSDRPNIVVVTIGLPLSGKSTLLDLLGLPIQCPDDYRWTITGQEYYKPAEPLVWAHVGVAIATALRRHNVVCIDATHSQEYEWQKWKKLGYDCRFILMPFLPDKYTQRAKDTGREHMIEVISRMAGRMDLDTIASLAPMVTLSDGWQPNIETAMRVIKELDLKDHIRAKHI